MSNATRDADRFLAWQLHALEARRTGSEMVAIGPFRALLSPATEPPPTSWVTLVDQRAQKEETLAALTELRDLFQHRGIAMELEYNEVAFPHAQAWLESTGLELVERNPLMACRPDAFRPFIAPEVVITQLAMDSAPADLEAFQRIRWTDGGEVDRGIPSLGRLRVEMAGQGSVFVLAWLGGEPAGTGVSHALKGAAEIVGVVTRVDRRRRGVAAAVTSELVRRHVASGGDFVFLDAANEDAARVYERLGFTRFGANMVYR